MSSQLFFRANRIMQGLMKVVLNKPIIPQEFVNTTKTNTPFNTTYKENIKQMLPSSLADKILTESEKKALEGIEDNGDFYPSENLPQKGKRT